MDPRIKAGIFAGESGGDYDALFGFSNRAGGRFAHVRPSQMTVSQVLDFTKPTGEYAQWVKNKIGRVATPVGGFQIVGKTLRGAVKNLGLTGNEMFDQATQDRLGDYILKVQGTRAWEGYKGKRESGSVKMKGPSGAGMSAPSYTGATKAKPQVTSGAQALFAAAPTTGQTQGESGIESGRSTERSSVSEALAKAYEDQLAAQKEASWAWVREAMAPRPVVQPFNIWSR